VSIPVMYESVNAIGNRILSTDATIISPAELSRAILEEIGFDADALRAALEDIMPSYANTIIAGRRSGVLGGSVPTVPSTTPSTTGSFGSWASKSTSTHKSPPPTGGHASRRVARVAAWYEEFMAVSVFTNDSTWKRMADCTAEDLDEASANSHARAIANEKRAMKYSALADRIRARGASSVKDLPDFVIADVWEEK
jgi:hypothetical protein